MVDSTAALDVVVRSTQVTMSPELGQRVARYKNSWAGKDPILNGLLDGQLSTTTVTDARESPMQHLCCCVWLSKQVDIIGVSKCFGEILEARQAGEVLVSHLDQLLVGEAAGADKHHAVGGVVVLDVVGKLGAADVADVFAGAEDGAAQRLVLVRRRVEVVEDDLIQLLLNLLGLAEDDVALALDGGGLELRVLEDVGEDVDGLGNVGVE